MEDPKSNNLLFKPHLAPHRHYESNAVFEEQNVELPVNNEAEETNPRQEIIDDLAELREMVEFLPEGLHFIGGTIDKLLQREKVIQYEESLPNPSDCTIDEKPVRPIIYSDCQGDCEVFNDCAFDCGTDCESDCELDCESDCGIDCQLDCQLDCDIDCQLDCDVNCQSDCEIDTDCGTNCENVDCGLDCYTDCDTNCVQNDCISNCEQNCLSDCGIDNCIVDCLADCGMDCYTDCHSDCETDCGVDCGTDCLTDCGTNCLTDCKGIDCETDCHSDCADNCNRENCYDNCAQDCGEYDCRSNCHNDCYDNCDNGCTENCAFLDCAINDCDCIVENDCDCLDCIIPQSGPTDCGSNPGDCVIADCSTQGYPRNPRNPIEGGFDGIIKNKTKYITYIDSIPHEEVPPELAIPDLFPSPTNITINLVAPRTLVQIARDSYNDDTIELHKYYIQRLQTVLQHYFQQMMTIMQEANVSNITDLTQEFDGDKVVVSNPMLAHLRDAIVRSQIGRTQKERMAQKMHSTDNTLVHMRAWHAAEKERERYYDETYGDSGNFLDSSSNELLRKSRSAYDKQYSQSLYNMYKYLNSSVISTGEALDMMVDEAKAKGKLMKEGVDIFASKKADIKKTRDEQIAAAQAEHDKKIETAKAEKPKDQNGKELKKNDKNINSSEAKYADFLNEGLPGVNADGTKDEDADSKDSDKKDGDATKDDLESDKQYQNDIQYLKEHGYTEEAAKAELAKLPQYKDRIVKQQEAKKDTAAQNEPATSQSPETVKKEAQADHPELFVNDKYVGDQEQAKKKAVQKAKELVSAVTDKNRTVKENNNMWSAVAKVETQPAAQSVEVRNNTSDDAAQKAAKTARHTEIKEQIAALDKKYRSASDEAYSAYTSLYEQCIKALGRDASVDEVYAWGRKERSGLFAHMKEQEKLKNDLAEKMETLQKEMRTIWNS